MTQVFEARHLQEELDELGEAGWELITASWEEYSYGGQTQQQARCILKRPVDDGEEPEDDFTSDWKRTPAGFA
jgi:hypothetical protein